MAGLEISTAPRRRNRRFLTIIAGSIDDQNLVLNGNVVQVVPDVSALFSATDLTYSVSGSLMASLNGNALEIDPNSAASGVMITLTATNGDGSAKISFALTTRDLAFSALSLEGTGIIGDTQTVTATANIEGATFSYDWRDAQGSIGATDQAAFVATAEQDQKNLFCRVTASLDGVNVVQDTNAIPITYAAPTASGGLVDQVFTKNTGTQTYDTSGEFTGADLTFSINAVTGLTINSNTGVISFDTDVMAAQSGTAIVVTATNSGGSAQSGFSVDNTEVVTAPARMTPPALTVEGSSQITATLATAVSDGGSPITSYRLRYRENGGSWTVMNDVTSPVAIIGLTSSTLYEVQTRAINSVGAGRWSASASATTTAELSLALINEVEEPIIVADSGTISITLLSGVYAGTYTQRATDGAQLTAAMVAAGVTPIVLPKLSGTQTVGQTLTVQPGLWLYDGPDPGDPTRQWVNDTDGTLDGETGLTYVLTTGDVGDTVRLDETFDGVTVSSASTGTISATATDFTAGLNKWYRFDNVASISTSGSNVTSVTDDGSDGQDLEAGFVTGPTSGVEILNSLNALGFDGTAFLDNQGPTPSWPLSGTLIIVHEPATAFSSRFQSVISVESNGPDLQFQARLSGTGAWRGAVNGLSRSTDAPAGVLISVYRFNATSGLQELFTNGTLDDSNSDYTAFDTVANNIYLGASRNRAQRYDGKVGEVRLFGAALSNENLNAACNALATKWGGTWSDL